MHSTRFSAGSISTFFRFGLDGPPMASDVSRICCCGVSPSMKRTCPEVVRLEIDAMRRLSNVACGCYLFQNASTAFIRRRFSVVT